MGFCVDGCCCCCASGRTSPEAAQWVRGAHPNLGPARPVNTWLDQSGKVTVVGLGRDPSPIGRTIARPSNAVGATPWPVYPSSPEPLELSQAHGSVN
eukprot:366565-Chlamydomonas_euryale.AAC.2